MNGKDLLCGMSFIDDKFVQEAENVRQIKRVSFSWKSYITIAACFLFIVSMSTIIPNIFDSPDNPPDYDQPLIQPTAPDSSYSETYSININQVFVNDVDGVSERSFLYDPELHDFVTWNMDDIVAYYGKSPIPAYIPDWLKSSPYNENATILVDKSGMIVNDLISFDFYHAYNIDGSPLLYENSGEKKGFTIAVSKIGMIGDCIYVDSDNLETTCIGNTAVIFGSKSTSSELYTAKFQYKDIHYLLIARQMQIDEVVKIVASIIYESENVSITK